MMRTPAIAICFLVAFLGEAFAATQQDYDDCSQAGDLDRNVAACERVIGDQAESVADRATAYIQRGNAYIAADKLDEAIADYGGAIQLDPKNMLAYAARAIAYWRKGDRDRAAADYRQAADLDAATLRDMTASNAELGAIAALAPDATRQRPAAVAPPTPPRVADDSTPIDDSGLLSEVRDRLYELNFDPGPPSSEATRQAIREFEQKNGLPPTGDATYGLLRRLQAAGGLTPWGAIVYDKDTHQWGMSWGESSRKAAIARAHASCRNGNGCRAELSFGRGECGAFAHSRAGFAIDARGDVGQAKDAALADCRKRGASCKIIASVCADGADRYSAAR